MNENHKPLTIYKASAGSGKTFTLSIEYIKLLILSPFSFRSTLAVTFTNKATEEMKNRILCQLYGIWKRLPQSHDYIDRLKKDLSVDEGYLSERAGIALHNIVNNYSYFRIETIDSFFQSVLRNLARELDLTANLRVELNDYQVERCAVDEIIDGLSEKDEILGWIMDYIHENMNDDKNWNVIGQIKKFGENIFREFYKTNSKRLNERLYAKDFFFKFTKLLRTMRDESEAAMRFEGDEFFALLDDHGIGIDDLKYGKSGIAGYFIKLRNGIFSEDVLTNRVRDVLDSPDDINKWVKKTTSPAICDVIENYLMPRLSQAENARRKEWNIYESCVLTLAHLNQLRLLNCIEQKVRQLNNEAGRFLLSDTHTLLHSLIQEHDSPFIFEKIGSYIETIMIDEFQDTSTIQWQNFKVLLEECMSHGEHSDNLIVGDVKQSIYRWRSGDWRMLNNIENEFANPNQMLNIWPLDTNYRSDRRVISFNNAFFTLAAQKEHEELLASTSDINNNGANSFQAEQLKKAYSDVCQKVPEKRADRGYIRIELLPKSYDKTELLERIRTHIMHLLDVGARLSDIAIIARSNVDIRLIADYLGETMPCIKLISNDAFRLDSSVAINIIIGAMHYLANPDDILSKAYVAKAYMSRIKHMETSGISKVLATADGIHDALPHAFTDDMLGLISLPLYELAERLYEIFDLEAISDENAYIYEFFDLLTSFISNYTSDINVFLSEWDDNLCNNTITTGAVDGIQLITIHKSKGLEFKHVIVPFCDWKLEKGGTIWCTPTKKPFNELPLVPVDFSAKCMRGTIYSDDYANEHLQNVVDNLNLLYVAFTRASSSLMAIGFRGKSTMRSYIIEKTISGLALEDGKFEGDAHNTDDTLSYTYGELDKIEEKKHEQNDNIFCPPIEDVRLSIHTHTGNVEFRQSNKSQEFVADEEDPALSQRQSYIKTGCILHQLFSAIRTTSDIDEAISALEHEGILDDTDLTPDRLRSMLHKRFANKQVAEWFSDKWTLFTECTILDYDPTNDKVLENRPDRVMKDGNRIVIVDFKFGTNKPAYADQVRRYISLMRSMGHADVRGYLWFVYTNEIEEIK